MADNRITFRAGDDLQAWLEARAARAVDARGPGTRARTELDLWRAHLAAELARQRWTLGEIGLIADVHNGVIPPDAVPAGPVSALAAGVIEETQAAPGTWGEKWGVNEERLVQRLLALAPTASTALLDAIAAWWADNNSDNTPQSWARHGVRVVPTDA